MNQVQKLLIFRLELKSACFKKIFFLDMYIRYFFRQISKFLEDSVDVFYGTKGLKSIFFYYNELISGPKSHKKRLQNLLVILKFVEKNVSNVHTSAS